MPYFSNSPRSFAIHSGLLTPESVAKLIFTERSGGAGAGALVDALAVGGGAPRSATLPAPQASVSSSAQSGPTRGSARRRASDCRRLPRAIPPTPHRRPRALHRARGPVLSGAHAAGARRQLS